MVQKQSPSQKSDVVFEEGKTVRERLLLGKIRFLERRIEFLQKGEGKQDPFDQLEEIDAVKDPEFNEEDGKKFELFKCNHLHDLHRASYSQEHLKEKLRTIQKYSRYRKLVRVTEDRIAAVRKLGERYKNFAEFLDEIVVPQLHLQCQTGEPLRLQNFCFVGTPGIGKTAFLTELTSSLSIGGRIFDAGTIQTAAVLNGLTRVYGNADVGLLFSSMLLERNTDGQLMPANTMFCIDEVEKMGREQQLGSALDLLLSLLERQTARRFVDACATELPLNLEHVNWCFTANSTHELSAPLRSRIIEVEIPAPTAEQALEIAASIFEDEMTRLRGKVNQLPDFDYDQLERLVNYSPRQQKQFLQVAIAKAIYRGESSIVIPNFEKKSTVRIGFV
jgi:ATP-dependent Lon protease